MAIFCVFCLNVFSPDLVEQKALEDEALELTGEQMNKPSTDE